MRSFMPRCRLWAFLLPGAMLLLGPVCQTALAQPLALELQGGPQLVIQAKAEQQQWIVLPDKVLVAAVTGGKLVVQEFTWPPNPQPEPKPEPGPQPDPQPKPDPQPEPKPARWQVAIVLETDKLDNLSDAQRQVVASILVREELDRRGHRLVGILDPDAASTASEGMRPWFQAAHGAQLPALLLSPMEGGTIRVLPLPDSTDALWRLLDSFPQGPPSGGDRSPEGRSPPSLQQRPSCPGGFCPRR